MGCVVLQKKITVPMIRCALGALHICIRTLINKLAQDLN